MKGVVIEKAGVIRVADVPRPHLIGEKDALLKVTHSSICGTDLHILRGHIPVEPNTVIGHEAVGIVEEVGSHVKRHNVGDRVVLSCIAQCGECANCREGLPALCTKGGVLGSGPRVGNHPGVQSEYFRVPYADVMLEHIPDELTEEQAIFAGDILSTGYMASENGCIRPGDVVVIFGAGPVGLCTLATARLFGPSAIVCVDLLDYRLEMAKRFGADEVINADKINSVEKIKSITAGRGADVTIEAVGSSTSLLNAINAVRGGGNISIVGIFASGPVELPLRQMLLQNIQIRIGLVNVVNMGRLLMLIKNGKLDVTPLITHRMALTQAEDAYRIFAERSGNVQKIILTS